VRASLKAGDLDSALEHVETALAIDPEYPAARAAPPPLVSSEAFARFEQRARQRRVERQLASARAAMGRGNLSAARAAMSEVRQLDAENAGLIQLGTALNSAERTARMRPRGAWVAAAAALAGIVFGATWLESDSPLLTASRLSLPTPRLSESVLVVGTAGRQEAGSGPNARPEAHRTRLAESFRPMHIASAAVDSPAPDEVTFLPALPVLLPPAASELPGASRPDRVTRVAAGELVRAAGDEDQVKETLQRYRIALEEDARSADAGRPGVTETVLERALDGLESQRINFDDCSVQVSGVIATGICRGSARYSPKAGSRDPRVESQTWHFTLRKAAAGWQVDAARLVP
jgi:hypothetical protein